MRIIEHNAHMKRRINLTIEAELVARAKALAHQRKSSISRLVEKGLQTLTKDAESQGKSFADKWMGKLKLAPRKPADPKREHLLRKYGLTGDADSHRH
jgi:hypothetical protein